MSAPSVPRLLAAVFRALLTGPLGVEARAELEQEFRARSETGGRIRATLWYAGHLLLPSTWELAFQLRRRARRLERSDSSAATQDDATPYLPAALVGGAIFLLYVVTLAPTTAFWDASEYITTAHTMGIPHPPGNPFFHVLARSWEVLLGPLGLTVAVRINLFSAFMSAAAHGFWFLVVERILRRFTQDRRFTVIGAAAAAFVSATAFTVWNQSNVNEKVYTVSLLTIALLTWLTLRWRESLGSGRSGNVLVLVAFVLGIGVGNHLMAFLAAPAIAAFVLVVRPRTLLEWKLYPAVAAAGLLGLSIHLVLPLRAALDPVINEADPRCETIRSALLSIATYGRAGCAALSEAITREQYYLEGQSQWWPRKAPYAAQLLNYLQYFDWQWARSLQGGSVVFAWARAPFTLLFLTLGVWGAIEHRRRDLPSFCYVLVLFATVSVALVFYLNFLFGYAMPWPAADVVGREARERDYFYLVSFSVWGLWAGMGIAALWRQLASRVGGLTWASPVLLTAALPLALNWSWATRSEDYAPRSFAYDALMSVEPYGVLFTNGDNDTFPLWYLQEVEGIRRDVTVIVPQYLNTPWYPRQLQKLTAPGRQRLLDSTRVRGLYPDTAPPRQPIVKTPPEHLDGMFGGRLERDAVVPLSGLAIRYPSGTVLDRRHLVALQIMHDSIDERPIYFSTSAGLMRELGLDAFAVRQGLVAKLVLRPLEEPQPDELVQGSPELAGEWFDYERSLKLYQDIYDFSGYLDRAVWPDHTSITMPLSYYVLALQLADVASKRRAPLEQIHALERDAEAFRITAQGGLRGALDR